MNLHRSSSRPDWESVDPSDRNLFQKIAAATGGFLTPANIVTIAGLGIVVYGLWCVLDQRYWEGLLLLTIGRLLDIADGVLADQTKTKSPLGELLDAVSDKIGTFLTIFVLFVSNVTDWWIVLALILPQFLIPFVIVHKRRRGISVHPTKSGKISMAAAWVGIVGLLLVKALNEPLILTYGIYAVIAASIVLGFYAMWQYATGRD